MGMIGNVLPLSMDIDGDGLPDRVLRVKGDNSIYVRRNLLGRVGLLRTIKHPQGGMTEIDYEYIPGTPQMPQSKYVMSRVTKYDGETAEERNERGEAVLGYESAHEWTTTFEYEGGYYDRDAKEQYGFNTVTVTAPDQTRSITKTNQGEYHLKGLPYEQQASNEVDRTWSSITETFYREAPYALIKETRSTVKEHGETMGSQVRYEYDGYGNVTRIEDTGDGVPDLRAEIAWGNPNDTKYYHAHPEMITVTSNGTTIRQRSGSYDRETGALTSQTQYGGNNNNITTTIAYDRYGNLARIANGDRSWVGYTWDNTQHQYPVTIQRGGGTSIGPYTSKIEWDYALGVKTKETDENGEVIHYTYDPYGRLIEVQSPYDGTIPAVKYEYHTEQGKRWYAVTENKVSFDPTDDNALTTVVAIDGLGRTIVTAKEGVRREGDYDIHGWNVAGAAVVDEKGRTIAQGQSEFVEYGEPAAIASYAYPGKPNEEYDNEYNLRYPTTTKYDTQDRPIQVTLPDDSLQEMRYEIANRQRIVTGIDPMGNKSVQYSDVRGNIVKVERYGKDNSLLTSARYVYNAIGEMEQAIDHGTNELRIAYDLLGRKTMMASEDIGRKEYRYDNYGNLANETDSVLLGRGGQSIQYRYDAMNRLIEIDYPYAESESVRYEYGTPAAPNGTRNRVSKVSDESGSIAYQYGKLGETTEEVRGIKRFDSGGGIETVVRSMGYTSNYLGQLEAIRFHDGEVVSYEYNEGGQIQAAKGIKQGIEFPYVKDIGYDEFGQRITITYGNDVTTKYRYDPKRRWLSNIETKNDQSLTYQDIDYTLDRVGNVLAYENSAGAYTTKQTYAYDGLYQLINVVGTSETHDGTGVLPYYTGNYEQSYSFDMIGNMTKKVSTIQNNRSDPRGLNYNMTYEYTGSPHRASKIGDTYYEYDGNGNLVREYYGTGTIPSGREHPLYEEDGIYSTDYGFALREGTGGSTGTNERTYEWNERNQLRASMGQWQVQYRYGADGERAIKYGTSGARQSETLYFNKMLQIGYGETTVYGGATESKHIYVGETRIVTKHRGVGNIDMGQEEVRQYYYHGDHLGSAQVVTNVDGELYEHIEYTPYGELWIEHTTEEGNLLPFRFTAKEYDRETGLYYYGARYLDPRTSRWISTDPAMGEYIPGAGKGADGLPGLGGIFNTVNMHTYHYAGNNPINQTDPNGRNIEVTASDNGTYTVTGGTLNSDRNIYIMQDGERTGEILGQTLTDYSFFGEDGVFVDGAIIDPNDNSGQDFIDDIISNTPGLIEYVPAAGNTKHYDFKSRGGNNSTNHYRGMPIKDENGNTVYASARDVGNIGAGFVAGRTGLSWKSARAGFDGYQSIRAFKARGWKNFRWEVEGMTTQKAERIGYNVGRELNKQDLMNKLKKNFDRIYHNDYGR